MKIVFATGNKFKAEETKRILKIDLEIQEIELDEIQEIDLEKVALHKLNQAYEIVKKPVMIDDVSFSVNVWNGFPGPLVKWILKAGNGPSLLLKMLEKEEDRGAVARLAIGYHDGKTPRLFIGESAGNVARENKGDNGFGWDRVFIPDGYTQTFAEMPPEIKDSISHRGEALRKLSDFLNQG